MSEQQTRKWRRKLYVFMRSEGRRKRRKAAKKLGRVSRLVTPRRKSGHMKGSSANP